MKNMCECAVGLELTIILAISCSSTAKMCVKKGGGGGGGGVTEHRFKEAEQSEV